MRQSRRARTGVGTSSNNNVGFSTANFYQQGFRWTQASGILDLGLLPYSDDAQALAANYDGSVVVGSSGGKAFRWTAVGGLMALPYSATSTRIGATAYAVSRDGGARMADGYNSQALGVSVDGSVVVGWSVDPRSFQEPFRWTATGGMFGLGFLGGGNAANATGSSNAVNADGSILVGQVTDATGAAKAFRWAAVGPNAGLFSLNALLTVGGVSVTGVDLTTPNGVSSDGQFIVGRHGPGV